MQGRVYVTGPIGDCVIIDVKVEGDQAKTKVDAMFQARIEDPLYFSFIMERIDVFDKKTVRTIM